MPPGEIDAHALLELAREAAQAAGEVLLARYRGPARGVGTKSSGTDMVSDADREAERVALERITSARPHDGVLAEETAGERHGSSGLRWVVDPLDGTTNFLYGVPAWVVSVACEDGAGGLAGVVHDPLRAETFCAVRGAGATLDGARITASPLDDLSSALLATGFSYDRAERALQARAMRAILPAVRDLRRSGSAARDLAWVACGRYDGYYEVPAKPWDRAAGELLVREAGGSVGRLDAIGPSGDGTVAAGAGLFERLSALVVGANGAASEGTGARGAPRWDTL